MNWYDRQSKKHLLLLHHFFYYISTFFCIIHRFTQYLHYKIRIIWLDSHLQDWTGEKKKSWMCWFGSFWLNQVSLFNLLTTATPWHTDLLVIHESLKKVFGEKALALIKCILFSSFCRSTDSLALIKTILFSSYCRNKHHFPTTLICWGKNKNRSVVCSSPHQKIMRKKKVTQQEGKKSRKQD